MARPPQARSRGPEPQPPAALIILVGAAAEARKEEQEEQEEGLEQNGVKPTTTSVVDRFNLSRGWWRPARCWAGQGTVTGSRNRAALTAAPRRRG